jgi:hypothetical protein
MHRRMQSLIEALARIAPRRASPRRVPVPRVPPRCVPLLARKQCCPADRLRTLFLLLPIAVLLSVATSRMLAEEPESTAPASVASSSEAPPTGELTIEGNNHIESLLLSLYDEKEFYRPITLEHPGPTASLPAGKYRLRKICLNDGYDCDVLERGGAPQDSDGLTISPDQLCLLKIGSLRHHVDVSRHDRVLHLSYRLLDAAGRRYTAPERDKPPRFTVYANGLAVGNGDFEYG